MARDRNAQPIHTTLGELKEAIREVIEETLAPSLRARPRLMKVSDAARLLGIQPKAVYEKIKHGRVRFIKKPGFPKMVEIPPEILTGL